MTEKYKFSPLIETVCELRFTQDSPWDMTIPGLFYDKIRNDFPIKEQRNVNEVEIIHGPQGIQQQIRTRERLFFYSNDRKIFTQIGPYLLSIHTLTPYPGWSIFKEKIKLSTDPLLKIFNAKKLQRIGMRYINRIDIDLKNIDGVFNIDKYFNLFPNTGENMPSSNYSHFLILCEFPFNEGKDLCRIQLTDEKSNVNEHSLFILDIDYFLTQQQLLKEFIIYQWIDSAHEKIEQFFEGIITDELRKILRREA